MGRIGITYSDVAKAAEKLIAEDARVTVEAVRSKLGTGSKSTIVPHLRRWRMKREQGDLAPGVLFGNMQEVYRQLQGELDEHLVSLRTELQNSATRNQFLKKEVDQLKEERQVIRLEIEKLLS